MAEDPVERDPIELGVELLERLEHAELPLADVVDRIETVSSDPRVTRAVLEAAERRGVIERDGAVVRPRGSSYVSFESDVISKEGEFSCQRCGTELSTGYFIDLDAGEIGPFGSTCIRKVTGRE
jgi:hypothetical protein